MQAQQLHVSSSTHAGVATAQNHGWQRICMAGKQWYSDQQSVSHPHLAPKYQAGNCLCMTLCWQARG